eukprot:5904925-Prymnesium_polylepis.1
MMNPIGVVDAADCGRSDVSFGPPPANRLELLRRRGKTLYNISSSPFSCEDFHYARTCPA